MYTLGYIMQVKCVNGPYYDKARKRISISKEDLPHLTTIDKHALDNVPEGLDVETFYFYDNPTLSSITADTR